MNHLVYFSIGRNPFRDVRARRHPRQVHSGFAEFGRDSPRYFPPRMAAHLLRKEGELVHTSCQPPSFRIGRSLKSQPQVQHTTHYSTLNSHPRLNPSHISIPARSAPRLTDLSKLSRNLFQSPRCAHPSSLSQLSPLPFSALLCRALLRFPDLIPP